MPEVIYVRVTQVRETTVSATSLEDALRIAEAEFNDTDIPKKDENFKGGHVTIKAQQTHLAADRL